MMKPRTSKKYTALQHFNVGPFRVKQPLPNDELAQVSPFLLLHHGGPDHYEPHSIHARLSPHPHRGFEPVTFVFNGQLHHKDSAGNEGFLKAGDVQWMTAGSGIVHSEGPSEEFSNQGGEMEIIQLWVNLPRQHKMTTPKYQDIKKEQIPVFKQGGFDLHLVAGNYQHMKGPASTFTPILAMVMDCKEGAATNLEIPATFNVILYVLSGHVESGHVSLEQGNMAVYKHDGDFIQIHSHTNGKLLLLAGEPIHEPMVNYGPFVMNYAGEIKQAILDYEMGKMGSIES